MRIAAPLLASALLLGLTACTTVGPDYAVPQSAALQKPAANGSFIAGKDQAFSSQPVPDGWWRLYHDPKLDQLIAQSLASNSNLRVAMANLQRALAMEDRTGAERNPHAAVEIGARKAQESGEAFLIEERLPVVNEGDAGIKIGYELDLFGKLKRADEAAHANSQASEAAVDLVRITVAAETARAYVQGCSASHQLTVARHELELQNRNTAIVQQLLTAGRGRITDLERARAQGEALRANLPRYLAEQDAARYRLAALQGKAPGELAASAVACDSEPQLSQALPIGDGAALLKRRPDIREAERQLAAATASIGVATAELYPSITLGASAGYTGLLEHMGETRTSRWALGPLLSWTIPDSGAHARVKMAKAGADAALARFDGVVLNALRETETALTFYAKDLERHAALRAARDEARKAAQDNHRLYTAGRAPYASSLDADRTLAGSDAALAAADAQLAQDQLTLFLALGGGWEQPSAQPAKAAE
ncbi:efflux transporter outer membrane subunit [Vogesella sp. LIG4]|uniref:efflux transporter outer membrane subunit n=1 Tax=Vogesella sp. LIG4 TaxID=1192162 RepID=UPI00082020CA|nr:efflux transporter outer membrane subunit [Vogesella sp. LIG4]SCK18558.1 efflux transporter, outer membrane factor (OMF) lipoprotein, NodT family [Vogesella sp. LIG4]